jgi:hypothetical protein
VAVAHSLLESFVPGHEQLVHLLVIHDWNGSFEVLWEQASERVDDDVGGQSCKLTADYCGMHPAPTPAVAPGSDF